MPEEKQHNQPAGGSHPPGDGRPNGPNGDARDVLVVEDDAEINELVGAYAEFAGFHYRAAFDGHSALTEAHHAAPSVVVLDLMLPDLDGYEVCRRLHDDAATRHVPVIILTALDNEQARYRCGQCGAAAYLTKPFDPDRLMETICRHAEEKE